mmetsp:Transcript_16864/g.49303  ORF Transcript_16864/g.49303 Transcript_16864/m.49303 type:complete len:398 (+) Transcript_16864:1-1194(+)
MSLAANGGSTLLQQLLACVKRAQADKRYVLPGEDCQLQAKVSLLRGFVDISSKPLDWTPGLHGLWYSGPREGGGRQLQVYLPEVASRVASGPGTASARLPAAFGRTDEEAGPLPEEHALYRFEALHGACPVANLPTMKTREVSKEHLKEVLLAQSKILPGEEAGAAGAAARFAVLTARGDEPRARAFIVPAAGAYSGAELGFNEGLSAVRPAGLERVRRIFVLAPVWDCYIDGCGLPERRCAWYGKMPLDLVVLERLRSTKAFTELTVEQDMRERAIEVLLPLVDDCLDSDQEFTLVPVLVGGLMSQKVEQYTKLLAPYLADSSNLFVVAGDVEELGESIGLDRGVDQPDGPRRWITEVPTMGQKDRLAPVFDSLELFLAVLAQAPQGEEFSLNRYW